MAILIAIPEHCVIVQITQCNGIKAMRNPEARRQMDRWHSLSKRSNHERV